MRRYFYLSVVLILTLLLTACPGAQEAEPTPEPEPTEEVVEEPTATPEEVDEGDGEAAGDLGTEDNPLVMSFVPSGDTQEIIASGEEIAVMMEERTDLSIEANVATSYAAVVEAMGAGNAHIGWLNTFGYLLARERFDVEPLLVTVRFGENNYRGQIVTYEGSGIESLDDITEDHVACWVDPLSTSGYIIPRVLLQANGIDPEAFAEQVEAGSHNNVIIAVYNEECDIGASFVDARTSVEEEYPDVMDKVNVVAESPPIPNDNVSVIPEMPEDMKQNITDALLDIASTEEGQEALNQVYSIEGLEEVDDSFYDEFRAQLNAAGVSVEELAE